MGTSNTCASTSDRNYRQLILKIIILTASLLMQAAADAKQSTCFGSSSNGKIINALRLPVSGINFTSYSSFAIWMGRTYVHSQVKQIIVQAYKTLEEVRPTSVYKYAETGFKQGGKFSPHKTHQNGLSVDFIVPVLNRKGKSVHLPSHASNHWGYKIEFNSRGRYRGYRIDFPAMAAHLVALDKTAKSNGLGLVRVIFDPKMQHRLFATEYGPYLKKHIRFSKRRSWVRHDEHYHVDFKVPCKKYSEHKQHQMRKL